MKRNTKSAILIVIICLLFCSSCVTNTGGTEAIELTVKKVENMESAFASLNPNGIKSAFNPSQELFNYSQLILNSNHLQGMAIYRDYVITNLNGHLSLSKVGFIFIYDAEGIIQEITTPEPGIGTDLAHTSGMQVIGDYLFIMMSGEDGEPNHMLIYDLKALCSSGQAVLFQDIIVEDFSSASIGGTVYRDINGEDVVVVCDKDRTLMKSSLGGNRFEFRKMVKAEGSYGGKSSELNNVAMFTDTDNVMWILGMESETVGQGLYTQYTDVLNLYRVDILEDGSYKVSEAVNSLECTPHDGKTFIGSHFRFGATAIIDENGYLVVYSTTGQCYNRLVINEYRPYVD